jgi:hypothetical protein
MLLFYIIQTAITTALSDPHFDKRAHFHVKLCVRPKLFPCEKTFLLLLEISNKL